MKMNSEGKWGQVVGNIVSEWTQIFGLVLLTKKLIEPRSKEKQEVTLAALIVCTARYAPHIGGCPF